MGPKKSQTLAYEIGSMKRTVGNIDYAFEPVEDIIIEHGPTIRNHSVRQRLEFHECES